MRIIRIFINDLKRKRYEKLIKKYEVKIKRLERKLAYERSNSYALLDEAYEFCLKAKKEFE